MSVIKHYQTIPKLGIKGRMDTPKEFELIGLPEDLEGKSVLDIGCNAGAFLVECAKRGAVIVDGVEPNMDWKIIAYGVLKVIVNGINLKSDPDIYGSIKGNKNEYDLVLCLSVTHVSEDMSGQEVLDAAWEKVKKGGMLILEVNDRLQTEKLNMPKGGRLYGKNKDNRSVHHFIKV